MVDVVSNPVAAAKAYSNMAKTASLSGGEAPSVAATPFGDMLEQATRSAIDTIRSGEKASAAGITGKMDPLAVTQALTAARITLDQVVAIRDQALDAYNKVIQMPI